MVEPSAKAIWKERDRERRSASSSERYWQGAPFHRGPRILMQHACFPCRKSWKIPAESTALCPSCRRPLADMGRGFKAPRTRDRDQWEKVRLLWLAGFRFPSSTWFTRHRHQIEAYPDRLRDVADFIRRNPNHPYRYGS